MEIALLGLAGGAELGAGVAAVWMVVGMLLLCGLACLLLRFPSHGMRVVFWLAMFFVCMLFQPWFCFVPSANPDHDPDITAIDGTYFKLGCCWIAAFGFIAFCVRRSYQSRPRDSKSGSRANGCD